MTMTLRPLTADQRLDLETLLDRTSTKAIVEALAVICDEKAEHVHANWQDKALVAAWTHNAKVLDKATARLRSTT